MDSQEESRKNAELWAADWEARKDSRRLYLLIGIIIGFVLISAGTYYFTIHSTRMIFKSADEMRTYMQGTFRSDREAFVFEGNEVSHIYYLADDLNEETDVNKDRVSEWKYRTGVVDFGYMSDATLRKDGTLVQDEIVFYKE